VARVPDSAGGQDPDVCEASTFKYSAFEMSYYEECIIINVITI